MMRAMAVKCRRSGRWLGADGSYGGLSSARLFPDTPAAVLAAAAVPFRRPDEDTEPELVTVKVLAVSDGRRMPDIVCLCGSTKFKKEFLEEAKKEAAAGNIVLSVGWFSHADGDTLPPGMEEKLDELHKRKLDLCDRVTVINVGGYIGRSTRSEIDYALRLGKPIAYKEDV